MTPLPHTGSRLTIYAGGLSAVAGAPRLATQDQRLRRRKVSGLADRAAIDRWANEGGAMR